MLVKYFKNIIPISLYIFTLLIMLKYSTIINSVLRATILLPIVYYFTVDNFRKTKSILSRESRNLVILFILYYFLYGYNRNKIEESLANIIFIVENIIIQYGLLGKLDVKSGIKFHLFSFLIIVILVVFIPSASITGSLELGAFYNLIDDRLLTTTTIEGPLLVSILLLYSFFELLINKNFSIVNVVSAVLSIYILLLFNRRGFIFSSVFSVGFYSFYQKTKYYKIIYVIFLFLFLPMFWEIISYGVLYVSESDLFSSVIVRNDKEDLLTATGRVLGWNNILKLFFSADSKYIFGYFGLPPESLFISSEEGGRYQHAHNTFLQLFIDGGYLLSFWFLFLFFKEFKKYTTVKRAKINDENFYFLVIIFLFFLSSTESLIRGIQFSNFIYIYAITGFSIFNNKRLEEIRINSKILEQPKLL